MPSARTVYVLAAAFLLGSGALAAFVASGLAGDAGAAPVVPTTQSGALALLPAAGVAAASWRNDAYLVMVAATEGPLLGPAADPPFLYDTSADPVPGDGQALVWTFAYTSPERAGRLFHVSVGGDGNVLYARELPDPNAWCCVPYAASPEAHHAPESSPPPAPGRVSASIDAPAAVASALARPEFANFTLDHPVFQVFLALVPDGDRSVWHVAFRTATYFAASAVVDAGTGRVLHADAWPPLEPRPPCCRPDPPCCMDPPADEHVERSTTLSPSRTWWDHMVPVVYAAYVEEVRIVAALDGALPVESVRLQAWDAMGRPVGSAQGADRLEIVAERFDVDGPLQVALWGDRVLHDIDVVVMIDVEYADEPRAVGAPTSFDSSGTLQYWGEEWHYPVPLPAPGSTLAATLTWDRELPTDSLRLVLLDEYGNDVVEGWDAGMLPGLVTLGVTGSTAGWMMTVVVRLDSDVPWRAAALPFRLHVETAPPKA